MVRPGAHARRSCAPASVLTRTARCGLSVLAPGCRRAVTRRRELADYPAAPLKKDHSSVPCAPYWFVALFTETTREGTAMSTLTQDNLERQRELVGACVKAGLSANGLLPNPAPDRDVAAAGRPGVSLRELHGEESAHRRPGGRPRRKTQWSRLQRALLADPGRWAGGSVVSGPLGLLAVEQARRAAARSPRDDADLPAALDQGAGSCLERP